MTAPAEAPFLARASATLAEVVDYERTFECIAGLAVPGFARTRCTRRSKVARMQTEAASAAAGRVLVVDDNEDAADSLATLLGVMGYAVRVAYDGPEAIVAADEFQPDAALLDIGLPKLSGYDIARHMRATRGGGVLLVAITGWGQEDDRRRAREAGFDHHFTKPADFDLLLALLEQEFRHRRTVPQ